MAQSNVSRAFRRRLLAGFAGVVLAAHAASAHHGSSISYDMTRQWTTWATVTQFNYLNPHPTMTFDRAVGGGDGDGGDGEVEHWVSELLTNPSTLARQGWTRKRTLDALKPGTRVKLLLATSRAGGFSGIVLGIENEAGEAVAGRPGRGGTDLDGVPGGLQPSGDEPLPGEEAN